MMRGAFRPRLTIISLSFFSLMTVILAACSLPLLGRFVGDQTLPTPTPVGDTLTFLVPVYTASLEPGDTVPGTRLTFVDQVDSVYNVLIDGLPAAKRSGDSFAWSGVVAPGVTARYNLRLTTTIFGKLTAAGPVEITVFNPQPTPLPAGTTPGGALTYNNLAVQYRLLPGTTVPGTNLVYAGFVDPETAGSQVAQRMARLDGTGGHPFFALGDSLTWTGRLNPRVMVSYSLRVTAIDDNGLRLTGIAQLWIEPNL